MPTYHFIAKVPLTAYTTVEANSYEEAMEIASSEDRLVIYEDDDDMAPHRMHISWIIREVDEGPQDIELDPHKPTTL